MNFTGRDFGILMAMSIVIISMTFAFPALGLSGSKTTESDIPQFNLTKDRFNFTDEFPENPGTPAKGTLWFDLSLEGDSENSIWLHGDTSDGVQMVLRDNNTDNTTARVALYNWSGGSTTGSDIYNLENVGDIANHNNFSYEVKLEYTKLENVNKSDQTLYVEYTIERTPADTKWYSRIPLVGGLMSAGDNLAGMVGWIGSILYYFVATFIATLLNLIFIVIDVFVFIATFFHWLLSGYFGVVNSAGGFATVVTLIPGIILFLEFSKLGMVVIDILWIG